MGLLSNRSSWLFKAQLVPEAIEDGRLKRIGARIRKEMLKEAR
jgi:hypothetical protein